MNDAYKIFKQLEEKAKRTNQYKFYDKDELIDVIDEQQQELEKLKEERKELYTYTPENGFRKVDEDE